MFNLNDKLNKSIADAASKVMAAQPAKVDDHKAPEPISSDMVDRVMATNMNSKFRPLREDIEAEKSVDDVLPNSVPSAAWPKPAPLVAKTLKSPKKPGPAAPSDPKPEKPDFASNVAYGGGNASNPKGNYAQTLSSKGSRPMKEQFTSFEIVQYLKETTGDNAWYVNTKKLGAPVAHKFMNNFAIQHHVTEAVKKMKQVDEEDSVVYKEEKDPPFEGPYSKTPKTHKDRYDNVIKKRNMAGHLARRGLQNILKNKGK